MKVKITQTENKRNYIKIENNYYNFILLHFEMVSFTILKKSSTIYVYILCFNCYWNEFELYADIFPMYYCKKFCFE